MARCTVRNGKYSIELEAESLYGAVLEYDYLVTCSVPRAAGSPPVTDESVLYVELDGKTTYKCRVRDAKDWQTREWERRNYPLKAYGG